MRVAVIVVVLVEILASAANDATVVGDSAVDMLELDGGVVEVELVSEHVVDAAQDGIALRGRHVIDEDVAAQCS